MLLKPLDVPEDELQHVLVHLKLLHQLIRPGKGRHAGELDGQHHVWQGSPFGLGQRGGGIVPLPDGLGHVEEPQALCLGGVGPGIAEDTGGGVADIEDAGKNSGQVEIQKADHPAVFHEQVVRVGVAVDDLCGQGGEGGLHPHLVVLQPQRFWHHGGTGGGDGPIPQGGGVVLGIAEQGITLPQGGVEPGETFAQGKRLGGVIQQGEGIHRLPGRAFHEHHVQAVLMQHGFAILGGNDGRRQPLCAQRLLQRSLARQFARLGGGFEVVLLPHGEGGLAAEAGVGVIDVGDRLLRHAPGR